MNAPALTPNPTGDASAQIEVFDQRFDRLDLLSDAGGWTKLPKARGIGYRVLHTDPVGEQFIVLLKMNAGARLGASDARGLLHGCVVAGSVEVGGVVIAEGGVAVLKPVPGTSAVSVVFARETSFLLLRGEGLEVLPS